MLNNTASNFKLIMSSSQFNWVSFEESESTLFPSSRSKNLNTLKEETVFPGERSKSESVGGEVTKYAVFDSIRQLEQNGGDLGWSREILSGADGA